MNPKSPPQPAVSVEQSCPFCGGEVEWQKGADKVHPYRGVCKSCGSGTAHHGSFQACVKAWQTRAAPPADGVLVPVEPTREMVDAGRNAADDKRWAWCGYGKRESGTGLDGMEFYVRDAYAAMLSAAPKAPTAPIGEAAS